MKKVRIVAAVPHNDSEELEVILDVLEDDRALVAKHSLKSVWLDAHQLEQMSH